MKILVVGGAGYVGSHTIRVLARQGHEVIVYDNLSTGHAGLVGSLPLIVGDIRNPNGLQRALPGCHAVIHFAARAYVGESVDDPRGYFDTNIHGALCLLNAALDCGVKKFVFSSSCATYGTPDIVPITDTTVQSPINPYGESKLFFERALSAYDHAYSFRSVSLRYFNVAGAGESMECGESHNPETHLIPSAFQALRGERSALSIFGTDYPTPDGTCVRDYIHVSDLAEAHVSALNYLEDGGKTTAFNLGNGQGHSVREVLRTVEQVTGTEVPVQIAPRRLGDPPILIADATRAQQVLKWQPSRTLHQMVQSGWEWYLLNNGKVSAMAECT